MQNVNQRPSVEADYDAEHEDVKSGSAVRYGQLIKAVNLKDQGTDYEHSDDHDEG